MKSETFKKPEKLTFKESDLISSFMGLPRGFSSKKNREPVSIEKIVDRVWEDWKLGDDQYPERIISENWQKVVGLKLSGKCAPVNLSKDGKTLVIKAASSTIKQEILFIKAQILKRINSLIKCSNIKELKIY